MLSLVSENDKVQGCPLLFPDTAFYNSQGKVTEIIKTDKDGFLTSVTREDKVDKDEIRRTFSIVVRERRKEVKIDEELKIRREKQNADNMSSLPLFQHVNNIKKHHNTSTEESSP